MGGVVWMPEFPFLFGGTFIEGYQRQALTTLHSYFPSFSEGLSLREFPGRAFAAASAHFPSFSEGLSLRGLGFGYGKPR